MQGCSSLTKAAFKEHLQGTHLTCFELISQYKHTYPNSTRYLHFPVSNQSLSCQPMRVLGGKKISKKMVAFHRNLAFIKVRALSSQQKLTIYPRSSLRRTQRVRMCFPCTLFLPLRHFFAWKENIVTPCHIHFISIRGEKAKSSLHTNPPVAPAGLNLAVSKMLNLSEDCLRRWEGGRAPESLQN